MQAATPQTRCRTIHPQFACEECDAGLWREISLTPECRNLQTSELQVEGAMGYTDRKNSDGFFSDLEDGA